MEELVLVHPEGALAVHLAEVVEVQLADERLETTVPEEVGQSLALEARKGVDAEGVAGREPLRKSKENWWGSGREGVGRVEGFGLVGGFRVQRGVGEVES